MVSGAVAEEEFFVAPAQSCKHMRTA